MSPDPYGEPEKKPAVYDTVLGGLRHVNFGLTMVIGVAFVVIGIAALIGALVTGEQFLLPMGLFTIALGGVRLFLGLRR